MWVPHEVQRLCLSVPDMHLKTLHPQHSELCHPGTVEFQNFCCHHDSPWWNLPLVSFIEMSDDCDKIQNFIRYIWRPRGAATVYALFTGWHNWHWCKMNTFSAALSHLWMKFEYCLNKLSDYFYGNGNWRYSKMELECRFNYLTETKQENVFRSPPTPLLAPLGFLWHSSNLSSGGHSHTGNTKI